MNELEKFKFKLEMDKKLKALQIKKNTDSLDKKLKLKAQEIKSFIDNKDNLSIVPNELDELIEQAEAFLDRVSGYISNNEVTSDSCAVPRYMKGLEIQKNISKYAMPATTNNPIGRAQVALNKRLGK